MKDIKQEIIESLKKILVNLGVDGVEPQVSFPQGEARGDYTTNIAMAIFANSKFKSDLIGFKIQNSKFRTPIELAEAIAKTFNSQLSTLNFIDKIEAVAPGFINFWLSKDYLVNQLEEVLEQKEKIVAKTKTPKNIMVEYAHPNTHKEMHIGHMRTLITGEALARLFEAKGNKVYRANYQGDIGPHVAKALYGVKKLMQEENLTIEQIETKTSFEKAHFLGRAYVRGNQDYDEHKEEINEINTQLYEAVSTPVIPTEVEGSSATQAGVSGDSSAPYQSLGMTEGVIGNDSLWELYQITRQWSLDYYDEFYTRFYTKFDKLFFESEVAECGKKIVEENVGKVFEKDMEAIVFNPDEIDNKEEKHGLHTRVFVTKQGYPTYEGKEMCLGFKEYESFPFDRNIHVVGSEQAGYFKVVFKALEMLDPEKFKGTEEHLSMGMVTIVGMKMSSRTGELLRVDDLVDSVRGKINELIKEGKISGEDKEKVAEEIAIGAVKYSVLNVGVGQNVKFDIEKSVALDGNSGPYLQYTYARTQSVLAKSQISKLKAQSQNLKLKTEELEPEELSLLRILHRYPEVVGEAASKLSPNILCGYLFDLAQQFNLFYQRHSILSSDKTKFRLALTKAVGQCLKNGLYLLGIHSPRRM